MVCLWLYSLDIIYFIYKSNGKIIYDLSPANLADRIVDVLGRRYKDNLLTINLEKGEYSISGYVGNFNTVQKLGYTPVGLGDENFSNKWLKDDTGINISQKKHR